MEIKNIMIIGSGFMGAGIAQVGAEVGYGIYLYDVSGAFCFVLEATWDKG